MFSEKKKLFTNWPISTYTKYDKFDDRAKCEKNYLICREAEKNYLICCGA